MSDWAAWHLTSQTRTKFISKMSYGELCGATKSVQFQEEQWDNVHCYLYKDHDGDHVAKLSWEQAIQAPPEVKDVIAQIESWGRSYGGVRVKKWANGEWEANINYYMNAEMGGNWYVSGTTAEEAVKKLHKEIAEKMGKK